MDSVPKLAYSFCDLVWPIRKLRNGGRGFVSQIVSRVSCVIEEGRVFLGDFAQFSKKTNGLFESKLFDSVVYFLESAEIIQLAFPVRMNSLKASENETQGRIKVLRHRERSADGFEVSFMERSNSMQIDPHA
jgi:hypothetical protein